MRLDWAMVARVAILVAVSPGWAAGARAGEKKLQAGQDSAETADAGAFGVVLEGRRVATATFTIPQPANTRLIQSQREQTSIADPGSQKSNLDISARDGLLRHEWSPSSGGSLTVFPKNQFPRRSFQCQRGPGDFCALVPQDRSSMRVRLKLAGKEKIQVGGTDRGLRRLNLKGDHFDCALGVDAQDHFELPPVAIPADNAEVVRDGSVVARRHRRGRPGKVIVDG